MINKPNATIFGGGPIFGATPFMAEDAVWGELLSGLIPWN
jgi:hypothetical protein